MEENREKRACFSAMEKCMEEKYEKIRLFLNACDELIRGSFVFAEKKIPEVLKALAESGELCELFSAVTKGFDFPAAKRSYLRVEGGRGRAYLPTERREVLAFVFCLLVELDEGKLHLNDFLLDYFYVDGSYTASYSLFSERMLRPFCEIVRECYPDCGKRGQLAREQQLREEKLAKLAGMIAEERARITRLGLDENDLHAGDVILSAAYAAAGRRDLPEIRALFYGYAYFLHVVGAECERTNLMFRSLEEV